MTETEPVPSAGSHVGRYLFLREIAKGPFGPLYELRAEGDTSGLGGLGRLLQLPQDLSPETEQSIAEAAWDSMELRHEHTLCVADVVFGKGWITLIHDHSEGSLLRSLHRRAQERQSAFPLGVALRVALDILSGLEGHRGACESAGIQYNPGGSSAASLYLCGDGRTRLLDGQLMTTLLRSRKMRDSVSVIGYPAPELLDSSQDPDERTDVFASGAVLWELLTGRELGLPRAIAQGLRPRPKVPNLSLCVPKGSKQLPPAVVKAVNAALEFDPAQRPGSREEFRQALEQAAEAATYAQVIDFTDALLHRESTLFRLTLDPGPKLSDQLHSERPRPPQLEWALELAKRARPEGSSRPPSKLPRPPPKPASLVPQTGDKHDQGTSTTATTAAQASRLVAAASRVTGNPAESVTARTASDPKRSLGKHTLMGLSPSAFEPQRSKKSADLPSGKTSEAARSERPQPSVGPSKPPKPSKLAESARLADRLADSAKLTERRLAEPARGSEPEVTRASLPGESEGSGAAHATGLAGGEATNLDNTHSASATDLKAPQLLSAMIEQQRAELDAVRASSLSAATSLVDPIAAPATAPPVVPSAADPLSRAKLTGSQVLQLRLSTIAFGVVGLIAVAVTLTVLIQSSCSARSERGPITPASASAPVVSRPTENVGTPPAPSEPAAVAAPTVAEPSPNPPVSAAAPASADVPVEPKPAEKPAIRGSPAAAPKAIARKRRGQYVPSEL